MSPQAERANGVFIRLSCGSAIVAMSTLQHQPMFKRSTFIRLLAIPACLLWGLMEFIALQRAHGLQRKLR